MANRVTVSENAAPRPPGSIAMNTRAQVQARQNQAHNAPQASVTSDPVQDGRDARISRLEDHLFRLTGALARIGGYEPALEGIFGEQLETPPEREGRDPRPNESEDTTDPSSRGADGRRAQRVPRRPEMPTRRLHENSPPQDSRAHTDASRRSAFARLGGGEEVADSGDSRRFHPPRRVNTAGQAGRNEDLRHHLNRQWEIPRRQSPPRRAESANTVGVPPKDPLPCQDVQANQAAWDAGRVVMPPPAAALPAPTRS